MGETSGGDWGRPSEKIVFYSYSLPHYKFLDENFLNMTNL